MDAQKWTELARTEDELQSLRTKFSLAMRNADQFSARQLVGAIERTEKKREGMVADITNRVAAD
jgi:hypothetical protein